MLCLIHTNVLEGTERMGKNSEPGCNVREQQIKSELCIHTACVCQAGIRKSQFQFQF